MFTFLAVITLALEEIVKCILLSVAPESCFEFWRYLFSEAIVQELTHASVQMFLHAGETVAFVWINLNVEKIYFIQGIYLSRTNFNDGRWMEVIEGEVGRNPILEENQST